MIWIIFGVGFVFCASTIAWGVDLMNKDPGLSCKGNVGTAFVAAAGFCVFPFLNFIAGAWLAHEIEKATRK
jgi:hypothetical protein